MCGICGIIGSTPTGDFTAEVQRMNLEIIHRGPDDSGQFDERGCSLAMRRLAIIDLAGGHQPMTNEDGSLVIVFNGEIYNFQELRERLVASGRHQFRTRSDTEVILHLYEEHGSDTPRLLEGMFAFCIYDLRKRTAFFARDRFGEKPLFYHLRGNKDLVFSSELKSLVSADGIDRRVDDEALYTFLNWGTVSWPRTMFAGAFQVRPGGWLQWDGRTLREGEYYHLEYEVDPALEDEEAAKEELRSILLRAVKRQMIADVPLGVFLSGGIDSSAIVAAMQQQSSKPVKTFTICLPDKEHDESKLARRVAEHLGTEHQEFWIQDNGFQAEDLWRTIRHIGQPFQDATVIPTHIVSRMAREHVTVCLSGDGGDEMFTGYDYIRWNLKIDKLARVFPRQLMPAAAGALRAAAKMPALRSSNAVRQLRKAMQVGAYPADQRIWALLQVYTPREMNDLMGEEFQQRNSTAVNDFYRREMAPVKKDSRLRQNMYFRARFPLTDHMMCKVDRMAMANSLEVSAPLLDVMIADFARRLPDRLLYRDGWHKHILREAIKPWLPPEVFTHPKTGFSIPMHLYCNDEYANLCRELVLGSNVELMGQLIPEAKRKEIVEQGLSKKVDVGNITLYASIQRLYGLLQLAAWASYFKVSR